MSTATKPRGVKPSEISACARCGRKRRIGGRPHKLCRDCYRMPPNPADTVRWEGAACVDWIPEWWFADQPGANDKGGQRNARQRAQFARQVATAKAICADCPLRIECADYGTRNKLVGIWGGLTTTQRLGGRRR